MINYLLFLYSKGKKKTVNNIIIIMLSIVFWFLATALVVSAILVISLKNPVHSVLFLIFSFFNAAGLFILLGAEYIAMTLIIVYVGAVAVLFLFVVMMLDIKIASIKNTVSKHWPLSVGLALIAFVEIAIVLWGIEDLLGLPDYAMTLKGTNNTKDLGKILYTDYFLIFQAAGAILFIAMIGAIVLAMPEMNKTDKRQNICQQLRRDKNNSVKLVEVKSKEGVVL